MKDRFPDLKLEAQTRRRESVYARTYRLQKGAEDKQLNETEETKLGGVGTENGLFEFRRGGSF